MNIFKTLLAGAVALSLAACDSGSNSGSETGTGGETGAATGSGSSGGSAAVRDRIRVVGSSTVFPYSVAVAEEFAGKTGLAAPVVEATGTGGGMKIFCEGIGEAYPDVTGASRAIKRSEWELCQENGVTAVSEALIGFDGLSVGVSRSSEIDWSLSEVELYLALASKVPDPETGETLVDNPYTQWADIDPALPAVEIRVFGPPPTSGTRDAFIELVLHDACEELPYFQAKAEELGDDFGDYLDANCSRMRQDGLFIEAGENDNLIVQRLNADATALGLFGYSFLYENQDTLKAVPVNGVAPTPETIGDGSYDIARPLYIYSKNAHRGVIPGLNEFVMEYVSEVALGPDGYLIERGLTPLGDEERQATRDAMMNARLLDRFVGEDE